MSRFINNHLKRLATGAIRLSSISNGVGALRTAHPVPLSRSLSQMRFSHCFAEQLSLRVSPLTVPG